MTARESGGPSREEIVDRLAGFALFADLSAPQIRAIVHRFEDMFFAAGERVLRRGVSGSGFYLILEGSASVRVDGSEQNRLVPGDFFGEVSVLLGQPISADIVAETDLRCLVLPGAEIEDLLMSYPRLMYRILLAEARKLRATIKWRS